MSQDTIDFNSLEQRPLPKWLTDQRDGLNTYRPEILQMKEDHSLTISIAATLIIVVVVAVLLTIYILHKYKNRYKNESF